MERFDKTLTDKLYRRAGISGLLDRLEYVRQTSERRWRAKCPVHDGRSHDSLSIKEGDNGTPLLYCHGGCDYTAIRDALGIESGKERAELDRAQVLEMRRAEKERARRKKEKQQRIAHVAERDWSEAKPCTEHWYLLRKGVPSHGLRVDRHGNLLIPRTMDGKLWNLERIFNDGARLPLKGGRVKETYFVIGKPQGLVYLAEGYATAASVYGATGTATVCTFGATNMPKVARHLCKKHPRTDQIIAADNDETGLRQGLAAMDAGHAIRMVHPSVEGMDWNDFHLACGLDEMRREFNEYRN